MERLEVLIGDSVDFGAAKVEIRRGQLSAAPGDLAGEMNR